MILYIENPKDSTKNLLEVINTFSKVAEHKNQYAKIHSHFETLIRSIRKRNKKNKKLENTFYKYKYLIPILSGMQSKSPGIQRIGQESHSKEKITNNINKEMT